MKNIACFAITCLIFHAAIGQNDVTFSRFGSPDWSEVPLHFVQAKNGDFIVSGGRNSIITNEGNSFIVLLDSTGTVVQHLQIIDSVFTRCFLGLGEYPNGYFFILRSCSYDPPYKTIFYIITTDKTLNLINDIIIPYNDTMYQIGGDAIRDSRGDYLFCAQLEKPGDTTFPYVVKIDSAGNIKNDQFGFFPGFGSGWGANAKIIEDFENTGYFLGTQRKDGGGGDRILHLDSNFNIISDTIRFQTGFPYGMSRLRGLKKQYPDRIISAATTFTSGNLAVAAFDTLGQMLHFLERSKPGYVIMEGMNPLAVTDSSIFFASYYAPWGNVVFPPIENYITVQKLDNSFQELWEAKLGWGAYFRHSDILATPDGGCIVLASVYDSDTMYLRHDVVLFKLDNHGQLVGVTNLTPKPDDLVLFPNPGTTHFEIGGGDQIDRIEVYDASGRLVRNITLRGNPPIVDMYDAPAGLYVIRATSTTGKTFHPVKWVKGM